MITRVREIDIERESAKVEREIEMMRRELITRRLGKKIATSLPPCVRRWNNELGPSLPLGLD